MTEDQRYALQEMMQDDFKGLLEHLRQYCAMAVGHYADNFEFEEAKRYAAWGSNLNTMIYEV